MCVRILRAGGARTKERQRGRAVRGARNCTINPYRILQSAPRRSITRCWIFDIDSMLAAGIGSVLDYSRTITPSDQPTGELILG